MALAIGHWAIRGYGFFSVEHRATGAWVGRVGPWYPEGWPAPEVGWTLSPDHRGRGVGRRLHRAGLSLLAGAGVARGAGAGAGAGSSAAV